eukprot:TRINITY_DN35368_c0_g1_i1.p1 TRINITY_DN35368_c0_g1~~TRINITY_DN35368_c0_g1_i1.p1  ORF type:complete len:419 (-),score=42.66 TRINITY_DN35368_c0_g1_i1:280-1536(-)
METVPVDFDIAFSQLIPALARSDGWEPLSEDVDAGTGCCSNSFRRFAAGLVLGKVQYEIETPVPPQQLLPRPECMDALDTPLFCSHVVEVIAPGDAIMSMTFKLSEAFDMKAAVLYGRRVTNTREHVVLTPQDNHLARFSIRRDYPQAGDLSFVVAPQNPDTGTYVQQLGTILAFLGVYWAKSGANDKVTICHATFLPEFLAPRWASAHFDVFLSQDRELTQQFFQMLPTEELRQLDDEMYVILNLRGCSRGLPLLPLANREEYEAASERSKVEMPGTNTQFASRFWVRANQDGFEFTSYLHDLSGHIGIQLNSFKTLEGRNLAQYQAVVLRKHWLTTWPLFSALWQVQKAAYRKLNGGTTAPQIVQGCAARWRQESCADEFRKVDQRPKFRVRRTFIEAEDPASMETSVPLARSLSL